MKEKIDKKQLAWSEIADILEQRFAKTTPEKLFQAMDVKQGPRKNIDQHALTTEEAYRGIPLDKEMNVDLLKKMTLTRGIKNEDMQI